MWSSIVSVAITMSSMYAITMLPNWLITLRSARAIGFPKVANERGIANAQGHASPLEEI